MFVPMFPIFLSYKLKSFHHCRWMITVLKVITIVSFFGYLYSIHTKSCLKAVVNIVSVVRGGRRTSYDGHFRKAPLSVTLSSCSHVHTDACVFIKSY